MYNIHIFFWCTSYWEILFDDCLDEIDRFGWLKRLAAVGCLPAGLPGQCMAVRSGKGPHPDANYYIFEFAPVGTSDDHSSVDGFG